MGGNETQGPQARLNPEQAAEQQPQAPETKPRRQEIADVMAKFASDDLEAPKAEQLGKDQEVKRQREIADITQTVAALDCQGLLTGLREYGVDLKTLPVFIAYGSEAVNHAEEYHQQGWTSDTIHSSYQEWSDYLYNLEHNR